MQYIKPVLWYVQIWLKIVDFCIRAVLTWIWQGFDSDWEKKKKDFPYCSHPVLGKLFSKCNISQFTGYLNFRVIYSFDYVFTGLHHFLVTSIEQLNSQDPFIKSNKHFTLVDKVDCNTLCDITVVIYYWKMIGNMLFYCH